MRCAEITQEIATPAGRFSSDQIQKHLEHCPACASWSTQSRKLDQLLAVTRPEEPSAESFDTLWANVVAGVEAPEVVPFGIGFRSRRVFWAVAALANAAAMLLLAVTFWPRPTVTDPIPNAPVRLAAQPTPAPEPTSLGVVPVDVDVTCVIRINDTGIEVDRIDMSKNAPLLAVRSFDLPRTTDTDALNSLESMAE
jgi:hypothetical protein